MRADVCIVGGGPAGMAMARALLRHGVSFDVFERHDDVGGLWDPDNDGSPIYESAHFISSKTQSHYFDYPMPDDYPDYPSNQQILTYHRSFVDAYGLRDHVTFGTEVEHAEPTSSGWRVTLSTGEERSYRNLITANGTNWHPVSPDFAGSFDGELRHSQTYSSDEEFKGRRVLIVGGGNSGCDIACDAARSADAAFISLRRGYHFIPKMIFGIPADVFGAKGPKLPMWLEQRVFGALLRLLNGDPRRFGLAKPDHKLFESHPIMNTQILHHLAHGDIKAKPDVARLAGDRVEFVDGTSEQVDLIITATGYHWPIPYLPRDAFTWRNGRPELYLNLFSRTNPRLYVMGYLETNGGAYKLFDDAADLIARAIVARATGNSAEFDRLVATDRPDLTGGVRHVGSQRHQGYVESASYLRHLKKVRGQLGWPELKPGDFTRLRTKAVR